MTDRAHSRNRPVTAGTRHIGGGPAGHNGSPRNHSPRPNSAAGAVANLSKKRGSSLDATLDSDALLEFVEKAGSKGALAQQLWMDVQDALAKMHVSQMEETQTLINTRHKMMDDKLDRINDRLWTISTGNISVNSDQIDFSPLVNQLSQVSAQVSQVITDVQASSTAQAAFKDSIDGSISRVETNIAELVGEVQRMQTESKQYSHLMANLTGDIQQRLERPLPVDLDPVLSKVKKCCDFVEEDFHVVASELGVIQRSLHLEFVRMPRKTTTALEKMKTVTQVPVDDKGLQSLRDQDQSPCHADEDSLAEMNEATEPLACLYKKQARHRDFSIQTDRKVTVDGSAQTNPHEADDKIKGIGKKKVMARPVLGFDPRHKKQHLQNEEELKKKARENLVKPPYDVFNEYHTTGFIQMVAKSLWFDNATIAVVLLNTFWIAIDIDNNNAALITSADPIYQVMENAFCVYFTGELTIRFMAFANKCRCFRDRWFLFDSVLVINMIAETWIVPLLVAAMDIRDFQNTVDLTMLRALRMVKILRLSRMAKFIREVPELVVILKAIYLCARSMTVFLAVWIVIIYFFAIVFRQITFDQPIGHQYFPSVPGAMQHLLFDGVLAQYATFLQDVSDAHFVLGAILLVFVLVSAVTIMYMLMAVIVSTVENCMNDEKEHMTIMFIAESIRTACSNLGYDTAKPLTHENFRKLLAEPAFIEVLSSVQVDVVALLDSLHVIYEDLAMFGEDMNIQKVVDVVLNARGRNPSTVKDATENLRVLKSLLQSNLAELAEALHGNFSSLQEGIEELRSGGGAAHGITTHGLLDFDEPG
eukprot:TRINITY_DN26024_c0_g1_i1.p1 TRINITY_DN26024_c0_g1~~TRINITY_DN26024_c0_g1_i1.p1  ORF type:complete len:818 (+),score=143.41 TRINITY_DN26024_c0_g1_i1:128-2581(+)